MPLLTTIRGALRPRRLAPLAGICAAHGFLLWWVSSSLAAPPRVVPPSVAGVLVSQAPVGEPEPLPMATEPEPLPVAPEPKPVPVAPEPVKPTPVPRPKPTPKPVPKAPPSKRATTAPPAEPSVPSAAKVAEATAAPAPAAPPPLREVGESRPVVPPRSDAAFLSNPAPVYPSISRRLKEQGRVLFDVYILPDGSVGEIKLKRSSGYARLDESALAAVRRWRYVPAKRGDEPIPYWYVQPIEFVLDA